MPSKIFLGRKQIAIVDNIDADLTDDQKYSWFAEKKTHKDIKTPQTYVKGKDTRQNTTYLHRVIMERVLGRPLTTSENVIKLNDDSMDHRRQNLSIVNDSNLQNRQYIHKDKVTSQYKGVYQKDGKYMARIGINNRLHYLGSYTNEVDAARAYNFAATEFFGNNCRLNNLSETL